MKHYYYYLKVSVLSVLIKVKISCVLKGVRPRLKSEMLDSKAFVDETYLISRDHLPTMFKKSIKDIKSSTPLRSTDRKKFKNKIIKDFSLGSEDGDWLVPDPILSLKFIT